MCRKGNVKLNENMYYTTVILLQEQQAVIPVVHNFKMPLQRTVRSHPACQPSPNLLRKGKIGRAGRIRLIQ